MSWPEFMVCAAKGWVLGFSIGMFTLIVHILRTYIERSFRQAVNV